MIYAITTVSELNIERTDIKGNKYLDRDYRSCGYFIDKDKAKEAVLSNSGDMQERRYLFAVIEQVPEGVYPIGDRSEEEWFKWNFEEEKFEPSEKPSDLENTYGFSIG